MIKFKGGTGQNGPLCGFILLQCISFRTDVKLWKIIRFSKTFHNIYLLKQTDITKKNIHCMILHTQSTAVSRAGGYRLFKLTSNRPGEHIGP